MELKPVDHMRVSSYGLVFTKCEAFRLL